MPLFDHPLLLRSLLENKSLGYTNSILERVVTGLAKGLSFCSPYCIRFPEPNDRVCLPRENEVGIYWAALKAGIRSPLNADLERILSFDGFLLILSFLA
jgi:hypothetical protein